jgi:Family of unknown function (DUF6176)
MLETRCWKIKLKPGSIERVREWARTINLRMDEALEALRAEGVVLESVFLDRNDQGDFLIGYMKAESFDKAAQAVRKTLRAIDEYHQQFKQDVWDERSELELLVDMDRIKEL